MFKTSRFVFCSIFSVLFLLCFSINAQEIDTRSLMDLSFDELLKISVSSTLKEQKMLDVPASVSVITAAEIKIRGYATIREVLMDVPGYNDIADSNEVTGAVRGAYASTTNKILTLVNGHRMNEQFLGRYNLDQFLGLDAVERIEFIRGPVSVTWGTGALLGVVNIITKKGSSIDGTYAKVRAGTETFSTSVITGTKTGDYDVMASFTYLDQKGQEVQSSAAQELPYNGEQSPGAVYQERYPKNWSGMATVSNENSTFMIRGERYAKAVPRGPSGRYYDYNIQEFKPEYVGQNFFFDYEYRFNFESPFRQSLSIRPSYHWFSLREVSWMNAGLEDAPPYGTRSGQQSEQQLTQLKLTYKADLLSNLNITVGSDVLFTNFFLSDGVDMGTADSQAAVGGSDTNGLYVVTPGKNADIGDTLQTAYYTQAIWSVIEPLTITGGLRYDYFHSQKKSAFTTRLATVYRFLDNFSAKFAYGRSFLAPARAHTSSGNVNFLANPNLKPEIGDGIDFIVMYDKPNEYKASLGFFSNWYSGIITGANNSYVNTGRVAYRGFELDGSYKFVKFLSLTSSYSYVNPHTNETSANNLIEDKIAGIASHTFRAGLMAEPIKKLTLSLVSRTTSSVHANDSLGLNTLLPCNTVLDFSGLYEFRNWDFQLIARNILNHKYMLANAAKSRPMPYGGAFISGQIGYNF